MSYQELMCEIEKLSQLSSEVITSDCWGDMMAYLDDNRINYVLTGLSDEVDSRVLHNAFKYAILRKMKELHSMAIDEFQKEMFNDTGLFYR